MDDELKVGDVVQLKSGGPKMTVEEIGDYTLHGHRAKCVWFEGTKRCDGLFEPSTVKKA